jgi:hypothetical protein
MSMVALPPVLGAAVCPQAYAKAAGPRTAGWRRTQFCDLVKRPDGSWQRVAHSCPAVFRLETTDTLECCGSDRAPRQWLLELLGKARHTEGRSLV